MDLQKLNGSVIQQQYLKVHASGIQILLLYADFERELKAHSVFRTFCSFKLHGPLLNKRMPNAVMESEI